MEGGGEFSGQGRGGSDGDDEGQGEKGGVNKDRGSRGGGKGEGVTGEDKELQEAHRYIEKGLANGKMVVVVD